MSYMCVIGSVTTLFYVLLPCCWFVRLPRVGGWSRSVWDRSAGALPVGDQECLIWIYDAARRYYRVLRSGSVFARGGRGVGVIGSVGDGANCHDVRGQYRLTTILGKFL